MNFTISGVGGKFIALYGLEDLFDSLPETLEQLQIINRDNNNIIISIPPSITRFKDLNFILFDNCVDNAPDYLCELKKLRFLALMNNPKLKKIPDCVSVSIMLLLYYLFKKKPIMSKYFRIIRYIFAGGLATLSNLVILFICVHFLKLILIFNFSLFFFSKTILAKIESAVK